MSHNHLELFSGYGGFREGLTQAGFKFDNVYYSEIDKHAIANYKYNYPGDIYVGSVTDIRATDLPRINSISFGSPCQDFSLAGKRKGLDGERSGLIGAAIKLIRELRPDFYIWENVKGVYSSNHGADYWAVKQAFADIDGYRFESQLLNTAWFLPQNRERIYLVGTLATSRTSSTDIFPIRENEYKTNDLSNRRTANALCLTTRYYASQANGSYVVEREPQIENKIVAGSMVGYNGKQEFRSSKICPTIMARARARARARADGSGQPCIAVLTPDRLEKRQNGRRFKEPGEPAFTLTAQDKHGILQDQSIRRLTEIECERLQGLKDGHTKYGIYDDVKKQIPKTQRYKICGNGVSIPPVKAIGQKLLEVMK